MSGNDTTDSRVRKLGGRQAAAILLKVGASCFCALHRTATVRHFSSWSPPAAQHQGRKLTSSHPSFQHTLSQRWARCRNSARLAESLPLSAHTLAWYPQAPPLPTAREACPPNGLPGRLEGRSGVDRAAHSLPPPTPTPTPPSPHCLCVAFSCHDILCMASKFDTLGIPHLAVVHRALRALIQHLAVLHCGVDEPVVAGLHAARHAAQQAQQEDSSAAGGSGELAILKPVTALHCEVPQVFTTRPAITKARPERTMHNQVEPCTQPGTQPGPPRHNHAGPAIKGHPLTCTPGMLLHPG